MTRQIIAIVPSAGLGKRFSSAVKKTFATLDGVPLVVHTLKTLCNESAVTEVIPVLAEEDMKAGYALVKEHVLHKVHRIATGGKERQDSVYSALKLLDDSGVGPDTVVLVHDGVRPFVPEGLVEALIAGLDKGFDGAIPGLPVKETLKKVNTDSSIASTVDREVLWSIQTPQAFLFHVLKKAYDDAAAGDFYATDDSALVEKAGGRVKIIPGSPYNIKVTTPEDLGMIEFILAKRTT